MSVGILRYKGYDMPHNPEKLVVTKKHNDRGILVEIVGEGEFYGGEAHAMAQQLKALYTKGGTGALCVPASGAYNAEMTKLEFVFTDVPKIIRYTFSFEAYILSEDSDKGIVYIAEETDNLWTLSEKLECSVDKLVSLNIGVIKGITIHSGDRIIIPHDGREEIV